MPVEQCLKFTVERLILEDDRAFIDGRICGLPLRVGDTFTKVFGHNQRWDRDTDEWIAVDPSPVHTISLVIRSIESYRRMWDELSTGMTARVEVTGTGLDKLSESRLVGDDAAV